MAEISKEMREQVDYLVESCNKWAFDDISDAALDSVKAALIAEIAELERKARLWDAIPPSRRGNLANATFAATKRDEPT